MLKRTFTAVMVCTMVSHLPGQQVATPQVVKVEQNTVLQFALLQPLDPATTRPGDDVPLRLTQPLTVGGVVVLPVGSVVHGKVSKVTPPGRHCAKGSVKWKLDTIPLPDGSTLKTEVSHSFRPATGVSPNIHRHYSSDEIVGYVLQDVVLLPCFVAGMAIYEVRKAVTAPFRHGSCSRSHDLPLPANATVGVRIREDHQVRVIIPAAP